MSAAAMSATSTSPCSFSILTFIPSGTSISKLVSKPTAQPELAAPERGAVGGEPQSVAHERLLDVDGSAKALASVSLRL